MLLKEHAQYDQFQLAEKAEKLDPGRDYNPMSIRKWLDSRGLKPKRSRRHCFLSEEQLEFFKTHRYGLHGDEMAELMNRTFGLSLTKDNVEYLSYRYKAPCGFDGRIRPGDKRVEIWKKAIANSEKVKMTRFQKGHKRTPERPIGSTRISNGRHYTKTRNAKNGWTLTARLIWEEHNGPLPEGYIISYRDGNPLNLDIDNITIETHRESLRINQKGYRHKGAEVYDLGKAIAQLEIAIFDKQKGANDGRE